MINGQTSNNVMTYKCSGGGEPARNKEMVIGVPAQGPHHSTLGSLSGCKSTEFYYHSTKNGPRGMKVIATPLRLINPGVTIHGTFVCIFDRLLTGCHGGEGTVRTSEGSDRSLGFATVKLGRLTSHEFSGFNGVNRRISIDSGLSDPQV